MVDYGVSYAEFKEILVVGGLWAAHTVDALRQVRGSRINELELAGSDFEHGPKDRPSGHG